MLSLCLIGCVAERAQNETAGDAPGEGRGDSGDDGAGAPQACVIDADCVPAGSSCCGCPSFAVPAASGWDSACEEVDCGGFDDSACPLTKASCEAGACALQCAPVACDRVCPEAFARDEFGCLVCGACAEPSDPDADACIEDADCVRIRADCCGCAEGGEDTAIPASDAEAHDAALACDDAPSCPGVNTCDEDLTPRCMQGHCALVTGDAGFDDPSDARRQCGTSELPLCPVGEICMLNDPAADTASARGVGVCR